MRIQLSDHFTYKRLLRFVIPSILMLLCISMYGVVDGFFVSNYVGKTPFAAVNLIMPVLMAAGSIGSMIGAGGSAIVSKTLGEGKKELANQYFSMLVWVSLALSILLTVAGLIFIRPIARALGASGELLELCVVYARIMLCSTPAFVLQFVFQSLFVTAEKPGLSLKIMVFAGVTNVVLDYLFIAVFSWGIAGAAIASAIGQVIGGVVPFIYFIRKNDSLLQLTKAKLNGKVLLSTCANGSSEMVTNLSTSIVSILYNLQLMKLAGEDGVSAYGVIMYVNFIFMGIFIGFAFGTAPIISYHYGAQNHPELKNLFRKSVVLMLGAGVIMTVLAELLSFPLVMIFASYDAELFALTLRGFRLYSLAFLVMGINIWASSFFTALNNGGISAALSFLRTLVFQTIVVIALPIMLGTDGIWLGVVVAEVLALGVTIFFLVAKRKHYQYA